MKKKCQLTARITGEKLNSTYTSFNQLQPMGQELIKIWIYYYPRGMVNKIIHKAYAHKIDPIKDLSNKKNRHHILPY